MYEKPEAAQQWSVHAEVTISHNAPSEGVPVASTHTEQSGNGLRMVYSWTSNPAGAEPPVSDTTSRSAAHTYGFQRGGMVFTSTPPPRPHQTYYDPNRLGVHVQDSGYNSEQLLSPSSYAQSSLPRRPVNPYNRRCRSTCSIILSTAINADGHNIKCDTSAVAEPVGTMHHHCGRTQSLRCQTPTVRPDRRELYYGCGDPWCYHADDATRRCSPVMESCEECSLSNQSVSSKRPSRANTFTTHFCTRVPERTRSSPPPSTTTTNKDMASQTIQTSEKCTSPLEKVTAPEYKKDDSDSGKKKVFRKYSDRRKSNSSSRRNSDTNTATPSLVPPDLADNRKSSKRITRSPAMMRGISPFLEKKSPPRDSANKKPRTVHIDVYCTGSDGENSTESSSDSEQATQSSPQTVYESDKMRVSHRRAGSAELPHTLKSYLKDTLDAASSKSKKPPPLKPLQKSHSDSEEEASTAYPSALSSYSTMRDFESSVSTVPWSAMSTSTCTVPEAYDSVANTSCKDTVSDFENLFQKQFNLASAESEYFIPRRLNPTETPTSVQTGESAASLLPSDSFEYDDSEDRERIKEMERLWEGANPNQKTWKSPQAERKFLLQQQKMREYLEKRVKEKVEQAPLVKDSETESTEDDSEQGWSFVRKTEDKANLKRDGTVRRASKDALEEQRPSEKKSRNEQLSATKDKEALVPDIKVKPATPTNLTPKEPFPFKNVPTQAQTIPEQVKADEQYFKQRIIPSDIRRPFTIVPGKFTEQLLRAQKFGSVVNAVRKPGHHVGPAKNPDCLCDHCRSYYEESMYRNRTKSVGEESAGMALNWRRLLKARSPDKAVFSDF